MGLDIYLKVPRLEQGKVFKYNKDTNDDFNQKLIMSYFNRKIKKLQTTGQKGEETDT